MRVAQGGLRSRSVAVVVIGLVVSVLLTGLPAFVLPASPAAAAEEDDLADRADAEGHLPLLAEIASPDRGPAVGDEARDHGGKDIETFEFMPYVALSGSGETIRALREHPDVLDVSEDVPEPPALGGSIPLINADDTQALGWTGAGQTVAILDTGIDADHPFFNDNNGGAPGTTRIVSQACFSDPNNNASDNQFTLCPNGTTTDTSANAADVEGLANCQNAGANICDHGTHVAGIAAGDGTGVAGAPAAGVAPDANIIAIQVFTLFTSAGACNPRPAPCVLTFTSDQIAGMNRVLALDAANPAWNITSVNMSLGNTSSNSTPCDGDSRKGAIDSLLAAGIATVIAAGNNSNINGVAAPACISTAVTVGNSSLGDNVWGSSDRGPLLDLFAPGAGINSAIVDDVYGTKTGTSMAAPHVAGAFAVLGEAYPGRSINDRLTDMTSTGVPITYNTSTDGSTQATTPRLNLLAALQANNDPPSVNADDDPVTVDEGDLATNTGTVSDPDGDPIELTASVGAVTDNGGGTWSWEWQTSDGPDDGQVVTITATDDKGESDTATFALVVDNVAPEVTLDPAQATSVDEGATFEVDATFTDPGWPDTYTVDVDWGDGTSSVFGPSVVEGGPGTPDEGSLTRSHEYGDDGVHTVTITVTDDDGGAGEVSFEVAVGNVAPSISAFEVTPDTIAENGGEVDVSAAFTDPGWQDTYTATIDWGEGTVDTVPVTTTADGGPGLPDEGSVTGSHVYGDNGTYTVTVTVRDDDGGEDAASGDVGVTNVDPDLEIDKSDATLVHGVKTILAHVGDPIDFAADVADPGSDDLEVSWDWDDGAPAPDETRTYLVNPPFADPPLSPSVQPREVRDETSNTFSDACIYEVVAAAEDDDGGSDDDTVAVAITGLAEDTRSKGYWGAQYKHDGQRNRNDLDDTTLLCYLDVVQHFSGVFSETRSASTLDEAADVLRTNGRSDAAELLDAQLLAVWLNFANGALDPGEMVDTDGDGAVDSTFGDAVADAEMVRNDPSAARGELLEQKDSMERINLRDEGA